MPTKSGKRIAARKLPKDKKPPQQQASTKPSKSQTARVLRALQTKTAINKMMHETPTIQWDDGALEPRSTIKRANKKTLSKAPITRATIGSTGPTIPGPLVDANAPKDALYGKLRANWMGVDSGYKTSPTVLNQAMHHAIEFTGAPGNTAVQLRKGGEKFIHVGEFEGKAGIWVGLSDNLPGRVVVRAGNCEGRIVLEGTDSSISVRAPGAGGSVRARLAPTAQGCGLHLFDTNGTAFAYMGTFGPYGGLNLGKTGMPGRIELSKGGTTPEVVLDAETGDIVLMNADCAEEFDVSDPTVEPGTVLVLGETPGSLRASDCAYDTRVAGVISGAGGYRPGIVLDRKGKREGRRPVALLGKVFCRVEANSAPIRPGTLLTTSAEPGCAMAAIDRERAFGAVLGKALAGLDRGCALIPVLVALQ